jgi:hypothetical protein
MNWTKLSAVGEILSSVAILITLVYLGIQTQQNADSIMANTRQEILATELDFLIEISNFPEFEAIRYKQTLTTEERARLGFMLITFTRMRENNWLQYQNGVLDEKTWQSYRSSIGAMLGNPNARKFWQNYAIAYEAFDPQFTAHVSELLAILPIPDRSNLIAAFD